MASRLTDFLNKASQYNIGEVLPTVVNSDRVIIGASDSGGSDFVRSNRVYLQSEYPRLFDHIGLLNVTNLIKSPEPIPGASLTGIDYGNGVYVAVGNTSLVQTSTDAITWTTQTYGGVSTNILGVNFVDHPDLPSGSFFTCGANRRVLTSPNGSFWISLNTLAQAFYRGFTYKDQLYVAAGDNGRRGYVLHDTSDEFQVVGIPEGITATAILASVDSAPAYLMSGTQLLGSPDGITWSTRTSGTTSIIRSLTYGNGLYVYGTNGTTTLCLKTSTDSFTWTGRTFGITSTITALTFGNNLFVAGTQAGAIRTSTNGITWTARTSGTTSSITSLVYGNDLFVYAGAGGLLATSTDAVTWTAQTSGTTSIINSIVYGNDLFVYAGAGGLLATSTDAVTWTPQSSGTTENINNIKYANGMFMFVGDNGALATSNDAVNWQMRDSKITSQINTILYTGDQYVIAGAGGRTALSRDSGMYWDPSVRPFNLNGVNSYNDLYIAYGTNGSLLTSTDGKYWIDRTSGTSSSINSLMYNNGLYIYVGDGGMVATSPDLDNWTFQTTSTTNNIRTINFINGEYVISGDNGELSISTDLINWKTAISGTQTNILFSAQSNDTAIYVDSSRNVFSKSLDDKISDLYSPFYNTQTEFFVPSMSTSITPLAATDPNFTETEYQVYVGALR
jgi:hypothetical protein